MKKLLTFSALAVSLILTSFAHADLGVIRGDVRDLLNSPQINKNVAMEGADNPLVTSKCFITEITLIATASTATVVLYDNASAASGTVLADIGVATSGDSKVVTFPTGMYKKASNGVYADIEDGFVIINYQT